MNATLEHPNSDSVQDRSLITSPVVGLLLLYSTAWVTIWLVIFVAVPALISGHPFAILAVALAGWGPPFGALATGAVIAALWLFQRVLPSAVAVVASAVVGWSLALGAWWLLVGPNYFDASKTAVTIAVAVVGAVISVVVFWPRRRKQSPTA